MHGISGAKPVIRVCEYVIAWLVICGVIGWYCVRWGYMRGYRLFTRMGSLKSGDCKWINGLGAV
jgi:hypothetical protein